MNAVRLILTLKFGRVLGATKTHSPLLFQDILSSGLKVDGDTNVAAALAAWKGSRRIKSGLRELRASVRGTGRCFGSRKGSHGGAGGWGQALDSEFWILDSRHPPARLARVRACSEGGGGLF